MCSLKLRFFGFDHEREGNQTQALRLKPMHMGSTALTGKALLPGREI